MHVPNGEKAKMSPSFEKPPRLRRIPLPVRRFPDGRIAMREAKHVSTKYKDRLGPKQHAFARVAQRLFGDSLDLAVC